MFVNNRGPQPLGYLMAPPVKSVAALKRTINALESSRNCPPSPFPGHGKLVFQKTSPWCQKCWGLLLKHNCIHQLYIS